MRSLKEESKKKGKERNERIVREIFVSLRRVFRLVSFYIVSFMNMEKM